MLDRLKLLEENINVLSEFKKRYTIEGIRSDKPQEWALRYGLLETIQIVIDISCHLATKYNLGNPDSYAECIELLKKYKYIDGSLSETLTGMVGLRNILVHEYISIDIEKLYSLLDKTGDFKEFIAKIKDMV